jgi:hypothetical protein
MREVFIDEMGGTAPSWWTPRAPRGGPCEHGRPGTLFGLLFGKKVVGVLMLIDVGGTGLSGGLSSTGTRAARRDALCRRALAFAEAGFYPRPPATVKGLSRALDFYLKAGFNQVGTRTDTIWGCRLPSASWRSKHS